MRYRTTASPSGTLKPSRLTFRIYSKLLQDVFIFTVYMQSTSKIQTQCLIHYYYFFCMRIQKKCQNNQRIDGGRILVEVDHPYCFKHGFDLLTLIRAWHVFIYFKSFYLTCNITYIYILITITWQNRNKTWHSLYI